MTHPLTDEMCEELSSWYLYKLDPLDADDHRNDMRAAYDKGADDRLEQCITWLKTFKYYLCPSVLADELEKAMRPQEES